MHIPDGYLGPAFSMGLGLVTVPTWVIASRRVRAVLNNRTVPLLAVFSALSFTIMMFNIPVPGGTTAHGVGGTLIAIVLGPWAAIIGVSTALIIQAFFFGDGGILAIFANCLNMGIILPFVGYLAYRLIAGRSSVLSRRRVWAAGIGAYIGISVAALAVGVELGVQPLLFSENGHALYSPYGLSVAVPAMLLSHMFGASIVEALITAFGFAYLQRNHPEYLTSAGSDLMAAQAAAGGAPPRPFWQTVGGGAVIGVVVLLLAGLVTGGGDPTHLFGADWSQVSWPDVAVMLLFTLIVAVVLIPLAWFTLPRRVKGAGTALIAAAILAPLGLIAPGFAFGEGSASDVNAAFGYVPSGLQRLSSIFSAPLSGYNVPLPFFNAENAPLWREAIGYEISGIIGIVLLSAIVFLVASLLRTGNEKDTPRQDAVT